jgi:hypothetical protein
MIQIKFKDQTVNVINRSTRWGTEIILADSVDRLDVCRATVRLSDAGLASDEAAIFDRNRNEGILKTLIDNKIISEPIRYVKSGLIDIPICKVLM